ncbi:hypothetical protein GQX74_009464 [Glossina fuscipes]|nr:hypothetical protein GQX74_009464 [Glossina fuscipes]
MVKIWYAHLVGGNVALFSYFEFFSADESSNLEFLANILCFVIIMLSFVNTNNNVGNMELSASGQFQVAGISHHAFIYVALNTCFHTVSKSSESYDYNVTHTTALRSRTAACDFNSLRLRSEDVFCKIPKIRAGLSKSVEYEIRNAPKLKCDCTVFIEQKTNNSCKCFIDVNIKTILDSRCGGISLYVKDDLKVNVVFNTNIVILLLPIIKNALLFLKCVLNVVMLFVFYAIINRERTKKVHLFPRRRSKFTLFTKIFKHTANDIIYFRAVKRLMEKHERFVGRENHITRAVS